MARCVRVSCRRLFRERWNSFLSPSGGVSVPLLGTNFVETPGIGGVRSIVQVLLFVIFLYLGFIRKWKEKSIK